MYRMIFAFILTFSLTSFSDGSIERKPTSTVEAKALNNYVNFLNESIHGMLIIHRLLENFNLDINKYVDLDSYQINFYSNRDLPKDIFLDPENWFYDTSPLEWYDKIKEDSGLIPSAAGEKLLADASYVKDLLFKLNKKRFDIETLISVKDLTNPDQLQAVYDELESCADLFKSFYNAQIRMEKIIYAQPFEKPQYFSDINLLYRDFKAVLLSIRNKEDNRFKLVHKKFNTTVSTFNLTSLPTEFSTNKEVAFHIKNIKSQARRGLESAGNYLKKTPPIKDYELYGAPYYYYNSDVINKFNRYGSGIVFEINELLKNLNYGGILFTELPHYFKVIYPRKIEKINIIASETSEIAALPVVLEGRKISKKQKGSIKVDKELLEVEVFDHMVQDGDIVSINFNGEWVLRRHKLTHKPFKLKLKLNQEGKNFLVLHAENLGQRPPNTMAVSYFALGKKQMYVMNSDLNTSEMIEILTN